MAAKITNTTKNNRDPPFHRADNSVPIHLYASYCILCHSSNRALVWSAHFVDAMELTVEVLYNFVCHVCTQPMPDQSVKENMVNVLHRLIIFQAENRIAPITSRLFGARAK